MNHFERAAVLIRHHPCLERATWVWDRVRPLYNRAMALLGRRGLERVINSTDRILVTPRFRSVGETYEPEIWRLVMSRLHKGSVVAEVGAFIGLYTVAMSRRVGPEGRVVAFEPERANAAALAAHVRLNGVAGGVEIVESAAWDRDGSISFVSGQGSQSHVLGDALTGANGVSAVRLDTHFKNEAVDLLKIDVEGAEERVLRGASGLLTDPVRAPESIMVEVHPYAWRAFESSSASLLQLLADAGYRCTTPTGEGVDKIDHWGWIVARKPRQPSGS